EGRRSPQRQRRRNIERVASECIKNLAPQGKADGRQFRKLPVLLDLCTLRSDRGAAVDPVCLLQFLTETDELILCQDLWNMEQHDDRPRLPWPLRRPGGIG